MTEAALHTSVAAYLTAVLEPPVFWTTIAHGGFKLPVVAAARLKRAGLKAGVPDILIVHLGQAMFIELKVPKGKLSPVQIDTHYRILQAGAHCAVARSIDDVRNLLTWWKVPMRERRAA